MRKKKISRKFTPLENVIEYEKYRSDKQRAQLESENDEVD